MNKARLSPLIFSNFALTYLTLIVLLLSPSVIVTRIYAPEHTFLFVGLISLVIGILSFFVFRRMVAPLHRLIVRTEATEKGSTSTKEWSESSHPEWEDLETQIEFLKKRMLSQSDKLRGERAEFENILAAISDAIYAVDREGKTIYFNGPLRLLCGPKIEEMRYWEVFREPEINSVMQQALEGKISPPKVMRTTRANGQTGYYSVSVAPRRKSDGAVSGAVAVLHDVSELKMAELMRIEFVANASHELRSPLTSLKGHIDLLPTHQDAESIAIITRSCDRLVRLIHDLLDLSSIESSWGIQKAPVDTRVLTDRVLNSQKMSLEIQNREVRTEILVPSIFADAERIEQVLMNLLENANKYSRPSGKITIRWIGTSQRKQLCVEDEGPSIPIEHHARLFERFYRVDKNRSRDLGGTGLGLAIVKHIVEKHGGMVWVENTPDGGNRFYCSFES